jgi:hypothetical protein
MRSERGKCRINKWKRVKVKVKEMRQRKDYGGSE